jgi:succinyl-CoA synthetase beta subunit
VELLLSCKEYTDGQAAMANILYKQSFGAVAKNLSRVISRTQKRHLSLHEYQAQEVLVSHGVNVPQGRLATTVEEVGAAVDALGGNAVLKSQILAGGRGKGSFSNGLDSGVHIVSR